MEEKLFGLVQVARMVGVTIHQIDYAIRMNRLPEPLMLVNKRVFTEEDIQRIKTYFENPERRTWRRR